MSPESKPEVSSSDTELVQAIALGDEQAFASLYDRYSAVLLGFLVVMLRSRAEAEEVLLEVFLDIWQHASHFDEARNSPFAWLISLARRRAVSRSRERQRGGVSIFENLLNAEPDTTLSEQSKSVRQALAQMSDDERHILLSAFFGGLTPAEIGSQLNMPLATVRMRLGSALVKLREGLRLRIAENP